MSIRRLKAGEALELVKGGAAVYADVKIGPFSVVKLDNHSLIGSLEDMEADIETPIEIFREGGETPTLRIS